jgi:alkylation response protein AidB-like acyl-CoA dehydrogenase
MACAPVDGTGERLGTPILVSTNYQPVEPAISEDRADRMVSWLRSYADRRINSRLMDERRAIPPHLVLDFGNQGLLGLQVEEEYGGSALRTSDVLRVLQQVAAIDLGLGTWLLTSLFPGVRPVAAFGSVELRKRILRDLACGRMLGGYAQTEPGAGTNFAAIQAVVNEPTPGRWVVSGHKVWIGNGSWAGVLTVIAKAKQVSEAKGHLLALLVSTDAPGVAIGRELASLGMRGMVQSEVSFDQVLVAADGVLGGIHGGLNVCLDSMSFTRLAIAATCAGAMKRATQWAVRFAKRRTIATGSLITHPMVAVGLCEATWRIDALEALMDRVTTTLDAGEGVPVEIFAACKVAGSEFLWTTADWLVQVLGSRGYDEANLVPQLLRDARATRIFEGPTEALLAFLGSQASVPNAALHRFLRGPLDANTRSSVLLEYADKLRVLSHADDVSRLWQHNQLGLLAVWTLLSAALAHRSSTSKPAALSWVEGKLLDLLRHIETSTTGRKSDDALHVALDRVEGYEQEIGDLEQGLSAEKSELDAALRRGS